MTRVPHTEREIDDLLAALNAALQTSAASDSRSLIADDLKEWVDHFTQWSILRKGTLITPTEMVPPAISTRKLLTAVLILETRGSSIALHPYDIRKSEVTALAGEIGVDVRTMLDAWNWWSAVGPSIRRNSVRGTQQTHSPD